MTILKPQFNLIDDEVAVQHWNADVWVIGKSYQKLTFRPTSRADHLGIRVSEFTGQRAVDVYLKSPVSVPAKLEEVPGLRLNAVDRQSPPLTVLRHLKHQTVVVVEYLQNIARNAVKYLSIIVLEIST